MTAEIKLAVKALRAASGMQPATPTTFAAACKNKEEAYLLGWAHFQHDLTALAKVLEDDGVAAFEGEVFIPVKEF